MKLYAGPRCAQRVSLTAAGTAVHAWSGASGETLITVLLVDKLIERVIRLDLHEAVIVWVVRILSAT